LFPVETWYKFYREIAKKLLPLDAGNKRDHFSSLRSREEHLFDEIETKYVFIDSMD
jgi:hypothetical protein